MSKATVFAKAQHQFSANRETVFDAWFAPAHIRQWFGPGLGPLTRIDIDARLGGRFWITQDRNGIAAEHAGVYLLLERPNRLQFSWMVPPDSKESSVVTVRLDETIGGCMVDLEHEMSADWSDFVERSALSWKKMLAAMDAALQH